MAPKKGKKDVEAYDQQLTDLRMRLEEQERLTNEIEMYKEEVRNKLMDAKEKNRGNSPNSYSTSSSTRNISKPTHSSTDEDIQRQIAPLHFMIKNNDLIKVCDNTEEVVAGVKALDIPSYFEGIPSDSRQNPCINEWGTHVTEIHDLLMRLSDAKKKVVDGKKYSEKLQKNCADGTYKEFIRNERIARSSTDSGSPEYPLSGTYDSEGVEGVSSQLSKTPSTSSPHHL